MYTWERIKHVMSVTRSIRKLRPAIGGASIVEVAKRADASIVTGSRVFNDYPHVSGRMRDRLFGATRAVEYTPLNTSA